MPERPKDTTNNETAPALRDDVLMGADITDSPPRETTLRAVDPLALHRALETMLPMIRAIPKAQLIPIRLDAPTIAMFLLNRLKLIEQYQPTIAILPLVNQVWLGKLELIALALIHVDSLSKVTGKEPPEVKATFVEANKLREDVRGAALQLQKKGLVPRGSLATLTGRFGYRYVAEDLLLLSNVLRDSWVTIAGRTTLTMDDVNQCSVLAQLLLRTSEERTKRAALPNDLLLLKKQTYTLFLLAYDELRRCLDFIEPGAAKRLAPTLYQGRGRKRREGL